MCHPLHGELHLALHRFFAEAILNNMDSKKKDRKTGFRNKNKKET
jgi:hypothetical protein